MQCWKLSLKYFMILTLRKKGSTSRLPGKGSCGERVYFLNKSVLPNLSELSGKISIQPWGNSPCICPGHSGKTYTPSYLISSMGSLCYSSVPLIISWESWIALARQLCSDTWLGLAAMREAEAWPGSSHFLFPYGNGEFMHIMRIYSPALENRVVGHSGSAENVWLTL